VPHVLEPLVAGELGAGTSLDTSIHPPIVRQVQYVLDRPTRDDLIESFPVFLVSDALASALTAAGLTGYTLDDAEVIQSREYIDVYGGGAIKRYLWLRIEPSHAGDCWLDEDYRLCVSDRMMAVISQHEIGGCGVATLG
jgi:hypothetical protein